MRSLTWGVDGFGRQHICRRSGGIVLLCMIPGCAAWEGIELLEQQITESNQKKEGAK